MRTTYSMQAEMDELVRRTQSELARLRWEKTGPVRVGNMEI